MLIGPFQKWPGRFRGIPAKSGKSDQTRGKICAEDRNHKLGKGMNFDRNRSVSSKIWRRY